MKTHNIFSSIIFACSFLSPIWTAAQNSGLEYVIQVAASSSLASYEQNKAAFNPLKAYGVAVPIDRNDGIKVWLKQKDGSFFKTKEQAKITLKAVRKIARFKDAFIVEVPGNARFSNPNVKIAEKELVVVFTIRGDEPISIPPPTEKRPQYKIQLAYFSADKYSIEEMAQIYGIKHNEKSNIRYEDTGKGRRYFLEGFSTKEEAEKRKTEIARFSGKNDLIVISTP